MKKLCIAALASIALPFISGAAQAAEGDQTRLTGEFIDTWCYISEVMGAGGIATDTFIVVSTWSVVRRTLVLRSSGSSPLGVIITVFASCATSR